MSLIKKLYFSPVKSLSFNRATRLFVRENIGILNDRVYAFTRIVDENTSIILQNNPKKRGLKSEEIATSDFSATKWSVSAWYLRLSEWPRIT